MAEHLTKNEILGFVDTVVERIPVPEWGNKDVTIRSASAAERDEYEQSLVTTTFDEDKAVVATDYKNAKARLLVKVMLNEDGSRMFDDKDADALGTKHGGVVNRLFTRVQEISGMTKASVRAIEKNSGAGQNAGSN